MSLTEFRKFNIVYDIYNREVNGNVIIDRITTLPIPESISVEISAVKKNKERRFFPLPFNMAVCIIDLEENCLCGIMVHNKIFQYHIRSLENEERYLYYSTVLHILKTIQEECYYFFAFSNFEEKSL